MGLKEFFKDGSVVKGAAGYIIGQTFIIVVEAFTNAFVTPIFGIFGGIPEFKMSHFTINSSQFYYGEFVDAIIEFIIVGLVLYLCIILPSDIISKKITEYEIPEDRDCPFCFSTISRKASRCSHCSSEVVPTWQEGEERPQGPFCAPSISFCSCLTGNNLTTVTARCISCCPKPSYRFGCPCITKREKSATNTTHDSVIDENENVQAQTTMIGIGDPSLQIIDIAETQEPNTELHSEDSKA